MAKHAEVFISATTRDLGSYRREVKDALLSLQILPIEESTCTLAYRPLIAMLHELIGRCDAVIHIAGFFYGAEPLQRPHGKVRRSRWMTYRQAQTGGYQGTRARKSPQVQYRRFDEERKIKHAAGRPVLLPNGEPRTEKVRLERPRVFLAYVFKAEQIEGVLTCAISPMYMGLDRKSRTADSGSQSSTPTRCWRQRLL